MKLMQSDLVGWLELCGPRVRSGRELRFFKQIMWNVVSGLSFMVSVLKGKLLNGMPSFSM